MDQRNLLVLSVMIATLTGCATSRQAATLHAYEIDVTPPGKTTNFQPVEIDIAAGDVAHSVLAWARQTDMEVLFSADDVAGICTLPLKGQLYPVDALRQLLEGTDLTFLEPVIGAFVVLPINPESVQRQPEAFQENDVPAIGASTGAAERSMSRRSDQEPGPGCLPSTYTQHLAVPQ